MEQIKEDQNFIDASPDWENMFEIAKWIAETNIKSGQKTIVIEMLDYGKRLYNHQKNNGE